MLALEETLNIFNLEVWINVGIRGKPKIFSDEYYRRHLYPNKLIFNKKIFISLLHKWLSTNSVFLQWHICIYNILIYKTRSTYYNCASQQYSAVLYKRYILFKQFLLSVVSSVYVVQCTLQKTYCQIVQYIFWFKAQRYNVPGFLNKGIGN